jgi:hypothetical protein
VHQLRFASPIRDLSNQSSTIVALPNHLKIQCFDCPRQSLLDSFIDSSLNIPAFTQTIMASFSFPILRAIAIDVSLVKRVICKTRSFICQSDLRFVKDSPFFARFSLSNVIQPSFL